MRNPFNRVPNHEMKVNRRIIILYQQSIYIERLIKFSLELLLRGIRHIKEQQKLLFIWACYRVEGLFDHIGELMHEIVQWLSLLVVDECVVR